MKKLNITLFIVLFLANSILYYLYLLPIEGFLFLATILVLAFVYDIYKASKEEKRLKTLNYRSKKNKIKSSDFSIDAEEVKKVDTDTDTDVKWVINLYKWADENHINTDILPRKFNDLAVLTTLDLSNKNIVKLPNEICELVNLEVLDLSHNELTRLPHNIDKMTGLRTLHLSYNKLTDTPKSLARLTNITTLTLDNNRIKKQSTKNQVFNFLAGDVAHRNAGVREEDEDNLLNRANEEDSIVYPEEFTPPTEVPSFASLDEESLLRLRRSYLSRLN